MDQDLAILGETVSLFIRFWLTITPPLPTDAQAAAQLKGRQRYEGFVEALGRRLQKGQSLLHEIPEDGNGQSPPEAHDDTPESEPSVSPEPSRNR